MYIKSPFQGYSMYNQPIIQEDLTDFPPELPRLQLLCCPCTRCHGCLGETPMRHGSTYGDETNFTSKKWVEMVKHWDLTSKEMGFEATK